MTVSDLYKVDPDITGTAIAYKVQVDEVKATVTPSADPAADPVSVNNIINSDQLARFNNLTGALYKCVNDNHLITVGLIVSHTGAEITLDKAPGDVENIIVIPEPVELMDTAIAVVNSHGELPNKEKLKIYKVLEYVFERSGNQKHVFYKNLYEELLSADQSSISGAGAVNFQTGGAL